MRNFLLSATLILWIGSVLLIYLLDGYSSIYIGYFWIVVICLFIIWLALLRQKKSLKDKKLYKVTGWSFLFSQLILLVFINLFFRGGPLDHLFY